MTRRAIAVLVTALGLAGRRLSPAEPATATPQYRALWVDAFHDGMKSPAQVEKLVADANRANLNR